MNVTNNFFIVNGQATQEFPNNIEDMTYHLNFESKIYPLDLYGNYIWVGKEILNSKNLSKIKINQEFLKEMMRIQV
jgi:hypothetical protein